MSTFELVNEGVSTPAAERAFADYNKLLRHDPDQIIAAIRSLALSQTVEPHHESAANAVNEVLDATNNGTQIGLGPNTEAAWAVVFEDEGHRKARHQYVELKFRVEQQRQIVNNIKRQLATIDTFATSSLTADFDVQNQLLVSLEAELIDHCRQRGMQTLRVVAMQSLPVATKQLLAA